jgi:endonuclease/exonuclease/phosphatase (EEP) superfamily protein YafD
MPPLVRIDYVWHSDDFHAVEAALGPYLGSDHLPVTAALALESG